MGYLNSTAGWVKSLPEVALQGKMVEKSTEELQESIVLVLTGLKLPITKPLSFSVWVPRPESPQVAQLLKQHFPIEEYSMFQKGSDFWRKDILDSKAVFSCYHKDRQDHFIAHVTALFEPKDFFGFVEDLSTAPQIKNPILIQMPIPKILLEI